MDTLDLTLSRLDHNFGTIFITTFLLLLFFTALIKSFKTKQANISYRPLPSLFTPAESSFYRVLKQAVSDKFEIFGAVRIANAIEPDTNLPPKLRQAAFDQIISKHFNYVICDPDTLSIMAVIELDDQNNNADQNTNRDRLVNEICQSANIKLIRFDAKPTYQAQYVRKAINDVLSTRSLVN